MQMPESSAVLSGQVFRIKDTTDFETKAVNGARVAILSGDGATEVKLSLEQRNQLSPIPGDTVAWLVEPFLWEMNGKTGVSFLYRGLVTEDYVNQLHDVVVLVNGNSPVPAKN